MLDRAQSFFGVPFDEIMAETAAAADSSTTIGSNLMWAVIVFVITDGRLSILRLEQLLKAKITSNTTFQVKAATGGIGGGGGVGGSQQPESDVEVRSRARGRTAAILG